MKAKIISLALCIMVLVSLLATTALAVAGNDGEIFISAEKTTIGVGETVDIMISANVESVPVDTINLTVSLPAGLEYVSHEVLVSQTDFIISYYTPSSGYFCCASNLTGKNGEFNLLKITVRATEGVLGENSVGITLGSITMTDGETQMDFGTVERLVITTEIAASCGHGNKTLVEARDSDCMTPGWDAYYTCDNADCAQLFDASGNEIADIPLRPLSTLHTGGSASCQAQAVCSICGSAYGALGGHNYTAETKNAQTLKTVGNCRDGAVYYYSCSLCGAVERNDSHTFAGDTDPDNHSGNTAIVGAVAPNHKEQIAGYSGDTKCLDCGELLAYGEEIAPGDHVAADSWSSDDTSHYKVCAVEGCGIVMEGTTDQHTSDSANAATCQKQAVCSVCESAYGDLGDHCYTAKTQSAETLKSEGNCRDRAVYYYSCVACGAVERSESHTFFGDEVPENHVGGTTIVDAVVPNHKEQIAGYTGDEQCNGCGEILVYGEEIAPDVHVAADEWSADDTSHYKVCGVDGCSVVIESTREQHSSGSENAATCQKRAVCDICEASYGEFAEHSYTAETKSNAAQKAAGTCRDEAVYYYSCVTCGDVEKDEDHIFIGDKDSNHHVGGTTVIGAIASNHKEQIAGYTGNTQCNGCKIMLANGTTIAPGDHVAAAAWSGDGANHWKVCRIDGCGVVIESTAGQHAASGANAATCQKQAVCDICAVSYGDIAHHDWFDGWDSDPSGHWHRCSTADCSEKEGFAAHTPDHDGPATEEYAVKCSICSYIIEAQLHHEHVYSEEVATDAYKATNADCTKKATYYTSCKCGEKGSTTFTAGELGEHKWNAATCTTPKTCSVCKMTEGEANDHKGVSEWKYDRNTHWKVCVCGVKVAVAAHVDDDKDRLCDTCCCTISRPYPSIGIITPDVPADVPSDQPVQTPDETVDEAPDEKPVEEAVTPPAVEEIPVADESIDNVAISVSGTKATIDFSTQGKSMDTVVIPAEVVQQLAQVVQQVAEVMQQFTETDADAENGAERIEIILPDGAAIEFNAAALAEKVAQSGGADITITIKRVTAAVLSAAQVQAVGARAAFDVTVACGGVVISDIGGRITIRAPYELGEGEEAEGIVVCYVDDEGNREECTTTYDSAAKRVSWETDHLSVYMIDYEAPAIIDDDAVDEASADDAAPSNGGAGLWIGVGLVVLAAVVVVLIVAVARQKRRRR